jgi:restriction system protein
MPVPDFQSFMLPLLRRCADGEEHPLAYFRAQLAGDLKVSDDETKEKLPSGRQTKYENRIYWAAIYLHRAGCLERVRRGVFKITSRGQKILADKPDKVTVQILNQFPEFRIFHTGKADRFSTPAPSNNDSDTGSEIDNTQTPEEALENSYLALQNSLANERLATVTRMSPEDFEQLVVQLLVAMGYGGSLQDAGEAVGKSGDEGIDGIIKEDKLGLDNIYIQAKKWVNTTVGRPTVQAFAGSLEGHRARKGVMITTSSFSDDARSYVQKIEKKIVLIDGKRLAQLMIDHNVGVNITKVYTLKKLDQDFFGAE